MLGDLAGRLSHEEGAVAPGARDSVQLQEGALASKANPQNDQVEVSFQR